MYHTHLAQVDDLASPRGQEELVLYLASCIREDDPGCLAAALRALARIEGFTKLSKATGIRRTSLYRVLSAKADPSFSDLLKVTRALGFRLCIEALPLQARRSS